MNRADLQQISQMREAEAAALLAAGHYHGAYYLVGYAVECALKACVAKQVKEYDFPDKKLTEAVFTHDLQKLVTVAGLGLNFDNDKRTNPQLEGNWALVKDWKETVRYEAGITEVQARELYTACTEPGNGILEWIRSRW